MAAKTLKDLLPLLGPGGTPTVAEGDAPAGYGKGNLGKSFTEGVAGSKRALADLAQGFGADTRRYAAEQDLIAQEAQARNSAPQSLSQVGGVGDAFSLATNTLAKSGLEIGAQALAGLAIGGLPGAGAGAARGIARTAGAIAAGIPFASGRAVGAQIDQANEIDLPSALGTGTLASAINMLAPEGRLAALSLPRAATAKGAAGFLEAGAKGFLKEGGTEATEGFLTDALARRAVDQNFDVFSPEQMAKRREEFLVGGLVGGIIEGPIGGIRGALGRGTPGEPGPGDGTRGPEVPLVAPTSGQPTDLLATAVSPGMQLSTAELIDRNTGVVQPEENIQVGDQGELFGTPVGAAFAPVVQPEPLEIVPFDSAQPEPSEGAPFTPATLESSEPAPFNPAQGTLMLQDVGPGQEERTRAALAPFARGPQLQMQDLIDQQTGVSAAPANISAQGMARRLNEPVVNPITGESMGTMGDVYQQIADERVPPAPTAPVDTRPIPSGVPDMRASSQPGQRDIFSGKVYNQGATQMPAPEPTAPPVVDRSATPDMFGPGPLAPTTADPFVGPRMDQQTEQVVMQTAAMRQSTRKLLMQNKIGIGSKLGQELMTSTSPEELMNRVREAGDKTSNQITFDKLNGLYMALSGGEDIDTAVARFKAAGVTPPVVEAQPTTQEQANAPTSQPALAQLEPTAGPEIAPTNGAVQPTGGAAPAVNAEVGGAVDTDAAGAGRPDAEAVRAVPTAAEQQPALTQEPDSSATTDPLLAARQQRIDAWNSLVEQYKAADDAGKAKLRPAMDKLDKQIKADTRGSLNAGWAQIKSQLAAARDEAAKGYMASPLGTRLRPSEYSEESGIFWEKTGPDEWSGRGMLEGRKLSSSEMADRGGFAPIKQPALTEAPAETPVVTEAQAAPAPAVSTKPVAKISDGQIKSRLKARLKKAGLNQEQIDVELSNPNVIAAEREIMMAEREGRAAKKLLADADQQPTVVDEKINPKKFPNKPQNERQAKAEAEIRQADEAKKAVAAEFDELAEEKDLRTLDGKPLRWKKLTDVERNAFEDGATPQAVLSMVRNRERTERASEAQKIADKRLAKARKMFGGINADLGIDNSDLGSVDEESFQRVAEEFDKKVSPVEADGAAWLATLAREMPEYRGLIDRLNASKEYLRGYRVTFGNPTDDKSNPVSGKIEYGKKLITISDETGTAGTVLHELFHAAMDGRILADAGLRKQLNKLAREARGGVEGLFERRDEFETAREFINYYFTSPTFREEANKATDNRAGGVIMLALRIVQASLQRLFNTQMELFQPYEALEARMEKFFSEALTREARDLPPKGESYQRTSSEGALARALSSTPDGKKLADMTAKWFAETSPRAKLVGRRKLRRTTLGILTDRQIGRVFGDKIPELAELLGLRAERDKSKNDTIRDADVHFRKIRDFINSSPAGKDMINLAYDSTEDQRIWPDRPLEDQPWLNAEDKDIQAKHYELSQRYEAMVERDENAAGMFKELFDYHDSLRAGLEEASLRFVTDTYDKELSSLLKGRDELAKAQGLIRTLVSEKYNSDAYKSARTELLELRKTLGDSANSTIMNFANAIGDVKDLHAQPGPYLPLMRTGAFVYIKKSAGLLKAETEYEALLERQNKLSLDDANAPKVRDLKARIGAQKRIVAEAESAAARAKSKQNITRREAEMADAKAELARLREELAAIEEARKNSEFAKVSAEVSAKRQEVKRLRKNAEDYSVVRSDSEMELQKLAETDGGFYVPVDEMLNDRRVSLSFASLFGAQASKDLPSAEAAVVRAMAADLYLRMAPENSALKRQLKREGVGGYSRDYLDNVTRHSEAMANSIANVLYAKRLDESLRSIRNPAESPKSFEDRELRASIGNEMAAREQLTRDFRPMPLQNFLNQLGAFFFLGISPAFPILNSLQNALLTYPVLAAKFGPAKAGKMMIDTLGNVSKVYQLKRLLGKGSLDYEFDPKKSTLKEDEQEMLEYLALRDNLNVSQVVEMKRASTYKTLDTLYRLSWHTAHHTEVMNRLTAGLTAYRLAKADGMSNDAAKKYADQVVEDTHGNYNPDNRPRYFRQIYKPLTLFKSYVQMAAFFTINNARVALGNGKDAKEARWTLAYMAGMHQLLAGAMGLPGAGLIGAVVEGALDDEDEPWEWKPALKAGLIDTFGDTLGNVLFSGILPTALSTRVGATDVLTLGVKIEGDPGKTGGEEVVNQVENLLGPIAGVAKQIADASDLMHNDRHIEGFTALFGKGIGDMGKAIVRYNEGQTNKQGVVLDEYSFGEAAAQFIGFNPNANESMDRTTQYRYRTVIKNEYRRLLNQAARGKADADDIESWNEKNPSRPITPYKIRLAAKRLEKKQSQVVDGVIVEEGDEDFMP